MEKMRSVARSIVQLSGRMTYFKLVKLMYLVDYFALDKFGATAGCDLYIRQVDGPWPPKLNNVIEAMDGFELRRYFSHRTLTVELGPSPRSEVHLSDEILDVIAEICEKYGKMSNSMIKTCVYRTEPMRAILEQEKAGSDMRNKPILYKNKANL